MPIQSVVLYTRFGAYEPGNRYYWPEGTAGDAPTWAANLAIQQAKIQTTNVTIVRWEYLDAANVKTNEGSLNVPGTVSAEFSEFKYASFVRLNTGGPKRPSTKYVHALPESAITNGVPTSAWLTLVSSYGSGLVALGVSDSDGNLLNNVTFLRGTRRKNVRVAP